MDGNFSVYQNTVQVFVLGYQAMVVCRLDDVHGIYQGMATDHLELGVWFDEKYEHGWCDLHG
jgi:hypothetical protein